MNKIIKYEIHILTLDRLIAIKNLLQPYKNINLFFFSVKMNQCIITEKQ